MFGGRCLVLMAVAIAAIISNPTKAATRASTEKAFQNWIAGDLRVAARKAGISDQAFGIATRGLTLDWDLPDLAPPGLKIRSAPQKQSEFRAPGRYFSGRSLATLTKRGQKMMRQWRRTLAKIERRYGVPGAIIVAIWGRESGFGRVKMPKNAIRSLATEAFMGRRKALFMRELLAALRIVAAGDISAKAMGSSWAGALGQPQFLPSKFHEFAVDFDGDGRRDIWHSVPDTLASIAHYLQRHGWRSGRDWGFEARIPAEVSCTLGGPDSRKTIAEWTALGIRRISGKPFPANERGKRGYLLFPAGRYGPVFVTTPNFYVLKEYNESDVYALFVGHLADRMRGGGAFVASWQKLATLSRGAVQKMQQRLIARGYDVGGADGFIGYKTRAAIGKWQRSQGMRQTCFADPKLVKAIR